MALRDVINESREALLDNIQTLLKTGAALYMHVTEKTISIRPIDWK
jgi:hypothetical protein